MTQFFLDFIVLPIAVLFYLAFSWIDYALAKVKIGIFYAQCSIGYHKTVECGPHRQQCSCCNKHFDIDLMATNLEQSRIGFTEQTIRLGSCGKIDELPWVNELTGGKGNLLSELYRTYDILWVMWHDGMHNFRNDQ
jgi:hypothetical protein